MIDKNIYMAGPDITSRDIEIVNDALKNGWYGKDAYKYCELFQDEFDFCNIVLTFLKTA